MFAPSHSNVLKATPTPARPNRAAGTSPPFRPRTAVYNGYLIAGVLGTPGVMMWANGQWGQFGDGVLGNAVYALTTFNGDLFVGGQFTAVKNGKLLATNLARYDEGNNRWDPTNDTGPGADPVQTVRCLVVWNSTLFAGTEYSPSPNVFAGDVWYSWHSIGANPPSGVGLGLTVWNGQLIVLGALVTPSAPVLGAALNGPRGSRSGTGSTARAIAGSANRTTCWWAATSRTARPALRRAILRAGMATPGIRSAAAR